MEADHVLDDATNIPLAARRSRVPLAPNLREHVSELFADFDVSLCVFVHGHPLDADSLSEVARLVRARSGSSGAAAGRIAHWSHGGGPHRHDRQTSVGPRDLPLAERASRGEGGV